MADVASKVAVIGSGISGAVCASLLAKNGIAATVFESARGPGGRMSQRRERSEDGSELMFDHGAPCFTVNSNNLEVQNLVNDWESRGLVAEWKEKFGSFDFVSRKFVNIEEVNIIYNWIPTSSVYMPDINPVLPFEPRLYVVLSNCNLLMTFKSIDIFPVFQMILPDYRLIQEGLNKRYVGVPGMNSICKALCHEPGVESRFGCGVGRLNWLDDDDAWSLTSLDGQDVGHYKGVVASDKSTFSSRFTDLTGKLPPVDLMAISDAGLQIKEIPAFPCFALMLAFAQPLSSIPLKGFSFKNSETLSWAHCDSSKPGRSTSSDRWVLHSTAKYAELVISQTGFQKPSSSLLTKVAEELFQEFQRTGLDISQPFFKKAHRWGSAFPAVSIGGEEKCVWVGNRRLAICGDFCAMPNVEGAISSGIAAATKFIKTTAC